MDPLILMMNIGLLDAATTNGTDEHKASKNPPSMAGSKPKEPIQGNSGVIKVVGSSSCKAS